MRHLPVLAMVVALFVAGLGRVHADEPSRDAGRHFQRGVELYNDGDFRGALVELKKAYSLWPRASVLYDIGQTEYQILDYAAALKTMERFLAETGPNAAHRSEVESTVEILRGRVGHVALKTEIADCEVSVDEQVRGTTPVSQPLLVAVGPHRIAVACAGRPPAVRQVEVASGETVRVEVAMGPAPLPALRTLSALPASVDETRPHNSRQSMILSWSMSGVLAAATIAVGTATLLEADQLNALKQTFPVQHAALEKKAQLTTGLAIAADALGAATLAAVGVSTYFTVKSNREHERDRQVRVSLTGAGAMVTTTF